MRNWRINLILILIFLFSATLVGRLVFLQALNQDFYGALAKGQQKFFARTTGERGEIFLQDKNGDLYTLATNKNWFLVYISPNEISSEKKEEVSQILADTLDLNKDLIFEKLKKDSLYELIKNKLTDEEVENLREINLSGIYLGKEKLRNYPYQNLASNLLGFVNRGGEGQYGIEEYWDSMLRGKEGFAEGERGPAGYLFSLSQNYGGDRGADLVLTIDYNIQYLSEKLLKKASETLNIKEGQIIVIDSYSGKILTLANFPDFNPNRYSEERDLEVFQNSVIQKIFEPGSVFKPITMAAALDRGKITPQTTYFDTGLVKIGGYTIYNYDGRVWGEKSMTEVLEKSINTGAIFVEQQLGHNLFVKYMEKFGLFESTRVDLPGEIFSQNEEFKKGYEINFATASFGQGIEITPMQLVRAFCAIANGGRLVQPYLVEKIIKNGKIIETKEPVISDNPVISQRTSSKLTAMLVSVVENGFAKTARVPGYYIAGKTGTAQIPWASLGINKSGYSDETIQSFVGFAPAFNPRFLIMIKLNNPETKTAEYSAVPIFHDLAKYIIDYFQIPPDYDTEL